MSHNFVSFQSKMTKFEWNPTIWSICTEYVAQLCEKFSWLSVATITTILFGGSIYEFAESVLYSMTHSGSIYELSEKSNGQKPTRIRRKISFFGKSLNGTFPIKDMLSPVSHNSYAEVKRLRHIFFTLGKIRRNFRKCAGERQSGNTWTLN